MITSAGIIKQVTLKLRSKFPGLPVFSDNTKQSFDKDCFFIEVAGDIADIVTHEYSSDLLTLRITYFAINDRQFKTLLAIREGLKDIFRMGLEGDDFHIALEDSLNFTITSDNNLEMLLPLHYVQYVPEDEDGDFIENIYTNI